jgi:7,8-dihydropterin-6-yl-methyl-4-(beta-D-ribofuranosyl)aminobenzene 5'-phosphate synthase
MILNWLSKLSLLPCWVLVFASALVAASSARAEASKAEITVLYDAFGKTSTMKKDWGFSALIEYGDKRILFDTGNNAEIFAHNVAAKGIDLTKLDFAIVSHRHGDHTSGLSHLLKVNPTVKICAAGELWRIRRGLARHFLQAQRVAVFGNAIFRWQAAGDASFRQPVA